MIHVIHNPLMEDRRLIMNYELKRQGITDFKLWPALFDKPICKGISRAHKQIVRYAKEHGLKEVTIFEDDVKFPAEDGYQFYLDRKPKNFDLYLGGIYRGDIKDGKTNYFSSLHCYTVSERFYDRFLNVPESVPLDTSLLGLGEYYVCYPFAAIQYDGWSEGEMAFSKHEGLLKGKLIYHG